MREKDDKKIDKESTREFAEIYRKHTDPFEIKKRLLAKRREEFEEDKLSNYCLT